MKQAILSALLCGVATVSHAETKAQFEARLQCQMEGTSAGEVVINLNNGTTEEELVSGAGIGITNEAYRVSRVAMIHRVARRWRTENHKTFFVAYIAAEVAGECMAAHFK